MRKSNSTIALLATGTRRLVRKRKPRLTRQRLQVPDLVSRGEDKRCNDVLGFQHESSFPYPHWEMEGATKWDHICLDTIDDNIHHTYRNAKRIDQQVTSSTELKLEQAYARIEYLETEKRSQKKKLEQFLKKVSEERAIWRNKEHDKVRAIIDDMKADINREKKTRQRLETVNLNLVNELAESKLAVKRHMHDYQKEKKARELIEEVCDELAKEIEQDKGEIDALKSESMSLREEVDDERRMLQMAEVWREERVQMKLIDAKVTLEEKYSQMNKIVGDLEAFLISRNGSTNVKEIREAESLRETALSSVNNIQEETKAFTYEQAKPDDILMLFEDMKLGKNGEFEEDDSGWETESRPEEDGSSYSLDESIHSISNTQQQRDSNVSSMMNETEFEKTLLREIKEMCSVPRQQPKKISSIAKLWSSIEGLNGRISNARKSTASAGIDEHERDLNRGGFGNLDFVGQWSSSPESALGNVNRGGMKGGCIEWPRGGHKNNLKTKLIEAQIDSQKVQLKHVLEHKI